MKILYISYDGMTDPLGQSQVIPYLTGLSQMDCKITILSCEKKDKYEKYRNLISTELKSHNINWIPVPYSTLPSVFSKKLNLYRIKRAAQRVCKKQKVTIVHCRSYMAALIGIELKNKYNCKFIFDMRGFWADERIDGKIWNKKNVLHRYFYNYFKKKEILFISNADYIITLTQKAKKEILSWKPFLNNELPVEVIPCCVDLEHFSTQNIEITKQTLLKTKLQIAPTDFIISYLGSTGTWYLLDEMLDFFKCLSEKNTHSKFLFITPDHKEHIFSKAESKGITREKIIVEFAERKNVPLYLSLSQVSLYFIKPVYSKMASSPTKTGEIMALGIPIISNAGIGDIDQIISEKHTGMLVNEFTTNEYTSLINQLDVLLTCEKKNITDTAKEYFSLKKGTEQYFSVYKKIKLNR